MPQVFVDSFAATAQKSNSSAPENHMTEAPKSRSPQNLSSGWESNPAHAIDNAVTRTNGAAPDDRRVDSSPLPELPPTTALQGMPTHGPTVSGPPLASAKPRQPNPRPILEAFRTTGWNPRG